MILILGMHHQRLKFYKICIDGDPELTLTISQQGQIWLPVHLNGKNFYKVIKWEEPAANYQITRKFIFLKDF